MIDVKQLRTPPNTPEITFQRFELLEHNTLRLYMLVKGIVFKRIWTIGSKTAYWYDEDGVLNDRQALEPHQEREIEEIFMAYCLEQKQAFDLPHIKQLEAAKD